MDIVFTQAAKKDLRKLGHVEGMKIVTKLEAYAVNPTAFRNQVKKLEGENALRLRIGDYRVLFNEDGVILRVLRIGHRREIYR